MVTTGEKYAKTLWNEKEKNKRKKEKDEKEKILIIRCNHFYDWV